MIEMAGLTLAGGMVRAVGMSGTARVGRMAEGGSDSGRQVWACDFSIR